MVYRRALVLLALLAALAPAAAFAADTPRQVAEKFMAAAVRANASAAQPYMAAGESAEELMLIGFSRFTVGEERIEGGLALVPATAEGQGISSTMNLVLVREGENWRVSDKAIDALRDAAQKAGREAPEVFSEFARGYQATPAAAAPAAGAAPAAAAAPPAEPVRPRARVLVSIYKPILFAIIVGLWAFAVSWLDKDVARFHLGREVWNGVQIACGVAAVALWLFLPWFWLGLFLALLIMGGGLFGYVMYRNPRVPEGVRWTYSLASLTQKYEDRQEERRTKAAAVRVISHDGQVTEVPRPDTPEGQAHAQLEQILEFMLPRDAEAVELLADAKQTAVTVTIDGTPYPQPALEPALGLALIDYLKHHAGLDVTDRRRRQHGQLKVELEGEQRHTLALTTLGSTRGLSLDMRLDTAGRHKIPFDRLGLVESQKQQLVPALEAVPNQVVMVVCPPGQGMTTTLYSLVSRHDPYTQTIVTLEDDIQVDLEGVNQEEVDLSGDIPTLNQKIKALMLRETSILMISRLTDPSTVKAVVDGSDIARFYVGMRQDDNFAAMKAWVKAVGDPHAAAGALVALVAPRLVRRLCPTCKVPYKPDLDALRKLNLPADKVGNFFKHSGQVMVRDKAQVCPDCHGLGYRGRIAVFELMVLDEDARELVASGQYDQFRTHLRKKRTIWLQEAALAKVVEGQTSVSEITRVLAKGK